MTDAEPGVTATNQAPLSAVEINAAQPPSAFWGELLAQSRVRSTFINAVRRFAGGRTVPELYDALEERDVPVWLQSWVRDVARGDIRAAVRLLHDLLPGLGSGHSSLSDIPPTIGLLEGLGGRDREAGRPTVAVHIDSDFRDRPRQQRVAVLEQVVALGQHLDVRLVATQLTGRWLMDTHRETLPRVSDWTNTPQDSAPVEATVDEALAQFDPDGRPVAILRRLADASGGTQTYSAAAAAATASESRVRQCLGTLADHGLVERFGADTDRRVEILEAGRQYLSELDATVGRQQGLAECVSDPPKSHPQAVLSRASTGGGDGQESPYRTRWCGRAEQCLVGGAAEERELTLVETATAADADGEARRERRVSYDADREAVQVSVGVAGGLQYVVSTAMALASPMLLEAALSDDRLADLETDAEWLRGARQIGYLTDDALEDPDAIREAFVDAGEELAEMTSDFNAGEYADRDRFRGQIMRVAHGLAGSLVHLFDAVGVTLYRRLRLAEDLEDHKLREISKTVAIASAIQSRYGAFASYRQLYETDAGQPRLSPTIDAVDPAGHVIGGTVITGPDVGRLEEPLATHLQQPGEPVEDPEEFIVRMSLRRAGRDAYREVLGRSLQRKHLHSTEATTDLLYGLCPSPKALAEAVMGRLQPDEPRDIRPDEVRQILRGVNPAALLPELPPTAGAVAHALIAMGGGRVSQRELAERADVSTQSIRDNREYLQALDLIKRTDAGWQFAVAYNSREERREPRLPAPAGAALSETLDCVVAAALSPERYSDPEDPVGSVLHWPPDPWRLADAGHELGPWLALAARLAGANRPREPTTVAMGPTIAQEPVVDRGGVSA